MVGTWALNLFDRLHIGHHVLIDYLKDMPKPVAAITNGEIASGELELAKLIQPLHIRKSNLEGYLQKMELSDAIDVATVVSYQELLDIKDSTTFLMFEGPCCDEIEQNALKTRFEKKQLIDEVIRLKPVRALDGDKMSSARIRMGDVDREGRPLRGTTEHPRKLPDENRSQLKAPKGQVFDSAKGPPEKEVVLRLKKEKPACVIAVGDVTSSTLKAEGYEPDVCVVDGITKRGAFEGEFAAEIEYKIYNPPAMIYPEAWSVMDTAIHDGKKSLVIVEGEEDLIGFPALLLAEDSSVMLYGQPDVGIVWVPVNQENKKIARGFLEQMPIIF
ncbi:MAG: DUF359 domain-containing protein [Candidatus Thorarchaeota archaeon]